MSEIRANNLTFHVQILTSPAEKPDAPTVVFLHGLVVDNLSGLYLTLATPAASLGARAICYDQRGHGRSERPDTGYTLPNSVADLHALLTELGISEPVRLVGNSYGGLLALAFAAQYPDRVAGLFLIESLIPTPGWGERMAQTLNNAAAGAYDHNFTHMSGRKWDILVRQVEMLIGHTSLVNDMVNQKPFSPEDYAAITAPVLAIYGAESELQPDIGTLQKYVPQLELIILAEQSHMMLTQATAKIREIFTSWLR